MNSLFFLVRPFSFVSYCLIVVFFMLGCSEQKEQKFNCKQEYLQDCTIVKIDKIKLENRILIDPHKCVTEWITMNSIQEQIRVAEQQHQLKTVKAAEQFMIEDATGGKHRLGDLSKISLGIKVSYKDPWGDNPFNFPY